MSLFAVPSLLDPEQWLVCNQADRNSTDTNEVATRQLCNSLLLSERIVISDGFVFDNPCLWGLLAQESWRDLLTSACDVLSSSEQRIPLPARFRGWLYRDNEIVNPSAIRSSLLSDGKQRSAKQTMLELARSCTHRNDLSFGEYGRLMGFAPQPVERHLDDFFNNCTLRRKNRNRHLEFGRHLRTLVYEGPTFFSQGIPNLERDRLERYLGDSQVQHISRSTLEREYPAFWRLYAPIINGLRQLTYASHLLDGSGQIALNPGISGPNRAVHELIHRSAPEVAKKISAAAHVLQASNIAPDKILKLRQRPDFQECVGQLCVAEANLIESLGDAQHLHDYERALENWKGLLGPFLTANGAASAFTTNPEQARQIAGDVTQGLVYTLLTRFIGVAAGLPVSAIGEIASLSGSLAAKYALLGAGKAGRTATCGNISIRPGRKL